MKRSGAPNGTGGHRPVVHAQRAVPLASAAASSTALTTVESPFKKVKSTTETTPLPTVLPSSATSSSSSSHGVVSRSRVATLLEVKSVSAGPYRKMKFITYETDVGKWVVDPEAMDFLNSLKGSVALVPVVGPYRTGKSYLLDRILEFDLSSTGGVVHEAAFDVGSTVKGCTKGIWITTKIYTLDLATSKSSSSSHSSGSSEPIHVILADTEGLGDPRAAHDTHIFMFSLFLSATMILNTDGAIGESTLQNLHHVADVTQAFTVSASRSTKRDLAAVEESTVSTPPPRPIESKEEKEEAASTAMVAAPAEHEIKDVQRFFCPVVWVLRNWSLDLLVDGKMLTPAQYLEQTLADDLSIPAGQAGQVIQKRNHVRSALRSFFPRRTCVTLCPPCVHPNKLSKEVVKLDSDFLAQEATLLRTLRTLIQPKMVNDTPMTGRVLVALASSFVQTINAGEIPALTTAWDNMVAYQLASGQDNAIQHWEVQSTTLLARLQHETKSTWVAPSVLHSRLVTILEQSKQILGTSLKSVSDAAKRLLAESATQLSAKLMARLTAICRKNLVAVKLYLEDSRGGFLADFEHKSSPQWTIQQYHTQREEFVLLQRKKFKIPSEDTEFNKLLTDVLSRKTLERAEIMSEHMQKVVADNERLVSEHKRLEDQHKTDVEHHDILVRKHKEGEVKCQQLVEQLEVSEEERKRVETLVKETEETMRRLRDERDGLKLAVENLQKQLHEHKAESQRESRTANAQLATLRSELTGVKARLETAESERTRLGKELEEMAVWRESHDKLQEEVAGIKRERDQLRNKMTHMETHHQRLLAEHSEQLKALRAEITKRQSQQESDHKAKLAQLTKKHAQEMESKKREHDTVSRELETASASLRTHEVAHKKTREELDTVTQRLLECQKRERIAQQALAASEEAKKSLSTQCADFQSRIADLQREAAEIKSKHASELLRQEDTITRVRSETEEAMRMEAQKHQLEVTRLQSEIKAVKNRIAADEARYERVRQALEQERRKASQFSDEIDKLKSEIENLRQEKEFMYARDTLDTAYQDSMFRSSTLSFSSSSSSSASSSLSSSFYGLPAVSAAIDLDMQDVSASISSDAPATTTPTTPPPAPLATTSSLVTSRAPSSAAAAAVIMNGKPLASRSFRTV